MKRAMPFKTKWFYKVSVWSVIFSQVAFSSVIPANADIFDVGNVTSMGSGSMNSVISDIEQRYHINPTAVQNFGETMNTSANKEMAPQVNLFFNPSDPKVGKEIMAQAFPMYFSSQKESLYFTWYLKRKNCDLKSGNLSDDEESCDLDNDNDITVNDWKIEAMRRIANGGFAGDQVDYSRNSNDDDGYRARSGGDKSTSGYCYAHDFDSGVDYEFVNGCYHVFPEDGRSGFSTGDGSFGREEEEFWHTDPQDPSTAQNGNKDEANVVGMGQGKFTWNYASGDEVGVAVEGLSMVPTKYGDASMKIMWAFPKNKCAITSAGSKTITVAGYDISIPTADMNLNSCLSGNLVDPTRGDQAGKLELQLSSSPENPIMDSFSSTNPDRRGDVLTVQSILVNSATAASRLSYEWHVYANKDKSQTADDAWEDITEGLAGAHAISDTEGNDLSSLRINLNLDEATKVNNQSFFTRYFSNDIEGYFRINVTATENFEAGKKRVGRSSVIVKVTRAQSQIKTHVVDVDETNWKLKLSSSSGSAGLLCEGGVSERNLCPVVKGQIVGLSFDASRLDYLGTRADVSWVLNGKTLRCTDAVSNDSGCGSGKVSFFPITGDPGEVYTVSMTANNALSGRSLTLTRAFRVVQPSLLIASTDGKKVWPKYLGQYVDSNGKTVDNYSQDIFEAFSGQSFALRGMLYPGSLKNNTNVSWFVNGVSVVPDSNGSIAIDGSQDPGSVYTVSLKGVYMPSSATRKALADIWGISVTEVTEASLSRDVQVEMVQSVDGLAMGPIGASKKFFASLISYVPASVIFFFRLVVTTGLILLVIGVTFSFVPEKRRL